MFSLRQLVLFFLLVTLTLCAPFFIKDQLVKCMSSDPTENELSISAKDIHAYGLEYCATLVNTTNPKYLVTLDGQPSEIPQYYSGPWTKNDGGRLELCFYIYNEAPTEWRPWTMTHAQCIAMVGIIVGVCRDYGGLVRALDDEENVQMWSRWLGIFVMPPRVVIPSVNVS